ncbi:MULTISPECIES: type II secretion system F family protein [Prauserella salsuginis group]|uniref:Type II secretion system F family protein n=1 Tax=Prauserella salsuginis TaxID=387889 RepID=A0ABW6FXB3_9PSEU|nr:MULTISPECIES: type II secretion system F family protein [Prauserella salsuginis group]MCR3720894.1 tight adherence protein B [Prauserella flava]MCR3735025.1 tight adherence protein B [Prauserella salsuginis]
MVTSAHLVSSLTTGGVALLLWPHQWGRQRLQALSDRASVLERVGRRWRSLWSWRVGAVAALPPVLLVALWAGVGVVLAAGFGAAAVYVQIRARRRVRQGVAALNGLAEALRAMAGDLRSGAHPATAAESAAQEAERHIAPVFRAIAVSVRLGGEPDTGLTGLPAKSGSLPAGVLERVTAAWSLARRHGLALADIVDAVHRDVATRARLAGTLDARMAGPRASALILAGLPVLGVLLGEAMGAAPLDVLFTTTAGQALLAVGVALLLGGVAWTSAITGRVLPR